MNTLLLEIGTEEVPAGYIQPALEALSSLLLQKMAEARIKCGEAGTFGTPNRLAVEIANVSDRQESLTKEVAGPPKRVGFDEHGKPTVAAIKFAEKLGISVKKIKTKETKKGPYLYAEKIEPGLATKILLKKILPEVILSIPFPKNMRWADLSIGFARPIHSILALLGNSVIPFTLGNIKSGRYTFGHRFMHPGKIKVTNPEDYIEILRSAYVQVDQKERKTIVEQEISKAAKGLGGKVIPDNELVNIVTNLVEYPVVVAGKFDTKFLNLPNQVLITAMREHQKYFAVIDAKNDLRPYFIAVSNTPARNMALVTKGHERVLRARLEDAQFFYTSDLKESFDSWTPRLKGVLFQARLGSLYDRVGRIQKIAEFLTDALGNDSDLKNHVLRAAWLCKADLVSQVVIEFPKLQGVMGSIYASAAGEPAPVATAIGEHYLPTYSGGPLPVTTAGALLSIADKIDSICGCFSAGLIPTGTSDPYALRRQGIGIIQIMLEKGFPFSLREMLEKSLSLFDNQDPSEIQETTGKVSSFLQDRMARLLTEEGFSKDVIAAVVNVSVDHVPNVWNRVRALEKLKAKPDFEPLAIAFKRVVNIIKQARNSVNGEIDNVTKSVAEKLFQDACEHALFAAYKNIKIKVDHDLGTGNFDQALLDIASLRDPVDDFFDGVLVMTDDMKLRYNRLALLKQLSDLFGIFADFSKIST